MDGGDGGDGAHLKSLSSWRAWIEIWKPLMDVAERDGGRSPHGERGLK